MRTTAITDGKRPALEVFLVYASRDAEITDYKAAGNRRINNYPGRLVINRQGFAETGLIASEVGHFRKQYEISVQRTNFDVTSNLTCGSFCLMQRYDLRVLVNQGDNECPGVRLFDT